MGKSMKILVGMAIFIGGLSGIVFILFTEFSDDVGINILVKAGLCVLLAAFMVGLSFFLEPSGDSHDDNPDGHLPDGHTDH